MSEAELTRQLAQIAQSLRYIKDDVANATQIATSDREEYREEIRALRGDLSLYLYEQTRNRADIDDLKKKLRAFPNSFRL